MDFALKKYLTADDVIASGACRDGVSDFLEENDVSACMPVKVLLRIAEEWQKEYILKAANADGYGYGYGYGYGNGYGDGYGDGYGNGYGDGYGDGDGSYRG
ncbi:hypothetical protein [Agarilytica rhodophyticola]|uniref:hypothetical protein n=1 Tax=Agarilytica rhodophyticola TaxID=1737490 RepID=UPI000B34459E|nr:hypothetical protein [Agarilytica rhodophyticola]